LWVVLSITDVVDHILEEMSFAYKRYLAPPQFVCFAALKEKDKQYTSHLQLTLICVENDKYKEKTDLPGKT
jgi:hypothetical protein